MTDTEMKRQIPPVGAPIQYRQKRGSQAWLPAVITVTEETFVPGMWREPPVDDRVLVTAAAHRAPASPDWDGEVYYPAEIPPIKPGRVHLRIFSPTATDYVEWNVPRGEDPGHWRPVHPLTALLA